MSAPSFVSFPPSFGSFPDLEPGPSKNSDLTIREVEDGDVRKKKKKKVVGGGKERIHDRMKEMRDRSRREDLDLESRPRRERSRHHTSHLEEDDEHTKAREDRRNRSREAAIAAQDSPLYYSDRRGDPLNIAYGYLHAADIPKYHLAGCE